MVERIQARQIDPGRAVESLLATVDL